MDLADETERFRRGQAIEQREILGDDADAPFDLDGIDQRIETENAHLAAGGTQQSGQALDRRGLAGAIRSEESVEASRGDLQVDAVNGALRSERSREPARFDREFHHSGIV